MVTERITSAEMAIMKLLWKTEQMTARKIREQLYADSEKSQHGTVQDCCKNWKSHSKI